MKRWHDGLATAGWRGRGLDFLVGGAAVLGHAPFHIWPVTLISLAYLMSRLETARVLRKGGFGIAMWFGMGYFLCGTLWIGSAFIVRGPEFIPAMPPMILGLATILAFFWGLAGWVYARFFGHSWLRWIGLAGLLTLAEFARGHVLTGFPWGLPGYIFEGGGAMSQLAAFIGIYGLTYLVFLVSAFLAAYITADRHMTALVSTVIFLGTLSIAGYSRLGSAQIDHVDDVKIRIVQVPFSQKDKFERDSSVAIVNDFIRLSIEPGLENITHVVWPEGAVVGMAIDNQPLLDAMGDALTYQNPATPPYWLINSLRTEIHPTPNGPPKEHYYNTSAAIKYDKTGRPSIMALNDKYRLVPFGEFIPGGEPMEKFGSKTLSTSLASITPAPKKKLASFPGLPKVSPQICYEIIFSRLTPRPKGEARAEWILNQSNDAWYGRSIGPAQHANIARYRAIEEGIPVLRSASNGVSGVIDPYGRFEARINPRERGVLDVNLPKPLPRSYLLKYHNGFLFLIILLITGTSAISSRSKEQL
ncbi:MAG: apolipoprotein N-acyltransferase [Alphaproteobacteria bacterium]